MDTTIGFNTEVGRDTIVDSSSSGAQGLSDPTLESSDSSRPQSAHAASAIRSAPPPPPWPGPGLPPAEESPRAPRPLASTTQVLAPGNPHGTPSAPPAAGPSAQPASVAAVDMQLLQILQQQHQMMQQQQQQQHQMMQMMQGIMTPPAPPVRVPTSPLPTVTTRHPSAVERNPVAAIWAHAKSTTTFVCTPL